MRFGDKLIDNLVFGRSRLNSSVFEKFLISYSCNSFMKYCVLRSFCIKLLCFSKIWFFHASFMFRIHMHCIVFYIHLAILQSYLSLFSYITCIHFAKMGTQLDLKIDWLIFESFVHSSICSFYVWIVENYFLKSYDG